MCEDIWRDLKYAMKSQRRADASKQDDSQQIATDYPRTESSQRE